MLPECGPSPARAALDGSDRNTGDFGDVFLAKPLHIDKEQSQPLIVGKARQGLNDLFVGEILQQILRIRPYRLGIDRLVLNEFLIEGQMLSGVFLTSKPVYPGVAQDTHQPGFTVRVGFERAEILKRLEKRCLHEIVRGLACTAQRKCSPVHRVNVHASSLFEPASESHRPACSRFNLLNVRIP